VSNYQQPDLNLLGQEHVDRYRESRGEVGYLWNGVPALLLTTTGRRTGTLRTTPLIFGRREDDYLIVASKGGAPNHPLWYRNLQAQPNVEIQVMAEHIAVVARTASEGERPDLWKVATSVWPNYDAYQARTDRVIPVVILSPA
jgi:deazaflavin-dependent oxidoreductase (nitroreductase family)